jgi:tRNA threonylcarbamoyladenosine biosynthesis protein TsaB
VAVSSCDQILASEDFVQGGASAQIVSAVRRLLHDSEIKLSELDAVGVVRGPGSFTGMRTGLAVAKGLCEATGLPLISVSRLLVLLEAAGPGMSFAALDAGRGDLYIRDATDGRESLCTVIAFLEIAAGRSVVVTEPRFAEKLTPVCVPVLRPLHVQDALQSVVRALAAASREAVLAGSEALIDANYIRQESDIYRKVAKDEPDILRAGA